MATLTGGALDALRDQLTDVRSGSIRVVDVQVEARLDSVGEEYVQVALVISDLPPGQQTWSLDDAFDLRQHVRQAAAALGLSSPLSISMTVSGDADTEEDVADADGSTQASGEGA